MNKNNKNKNIKFTIFAIIFFILGFFSSQFFFYRIFPKDVNKNTSQLFWKVWALLEEKYPFEKPNSDEMFYGAIQGLVDSYNDDYSHFFPPKKAKQFNQNIHGEFGGIGVEIVQKAGFLVAVAPLKNSPAEKAGMLAGDIITHIDGKNIYRKNIEESISLIRGKVGSFVAITVARALNNGEIENIDLKIKRDIVTIPILDTSIIGDTFIISLYNFNENSASVFKEALFEFKKSKKNKLLLDVRNNPGGYLGQVVNILSYFIPKNKILLKEDFGSNKENVHKSSGFSLLNSKEYSIAILINRGSASASEILAGALKDYKKALIIGETSYGKGSVQELIELAEETSVKITVAKWLTPNGHQISKKGIEPDIHIDNINDLDYSEIIKIWNKQL